MSEHDPIPSPDDPIQAEADAWARRLGSGRPTRRDAASFRQWHATSAAHASAWTRASQAWRDIAQVAETYRRDHPQRAATAQVPARVSRRAVLGWGLSAGAALGVAAVVHPPLGLWPAWRELRADFRTGTGELREVDLADGARLALNTQTSVALRGEARVELLSGEAAFSTTPAGAPLEVLAGDCRIQVGTASGIEVRDLGAGAWRVRCLAGEAKVTYLSREILLAGAQQLSVAPGGGTRLDASPQASAWREGMVTFHDTPLAQAIEEINRYRPGRVVLLNDTLAAQRLSGRFRISALDEAIAQVQLLFNAKVRRVADLVLLS